MALWGGRFEKGLDDDAKAFSYSLYVDVRLVQYDILVNKAHAKALQKAGIFNATDFKKVAKCLDELSDGFETDPLALMGDDEDVHSCVERLLTERLGDLGKRLHTGKSRNDQVICDVRLFVKDVIGDISEELLLMMETLFHLAEANLGQAFPGFTHLQTAQPVLLSHHFLAYFEKFQRDYERMQETLARTDVCPLGSAALAGNNYDLDRELIADELGFAALSDNSMDAVSDRDFMVEFLSNACLCMTHLSRFSEELILWSSPLVGFVRIGDDFTTGSSIMPQKKNPDIAELTRGKAGRVLGNMTALIHILKGLPLTYNRDLQEDKELLFDTTDTVMLSLRCFSKMLATLEFDAEKIDVALKEGYSLATEFADYLVKKGLPFRDAHEVTGQVVLYAISNNKGLENLSIEEFKQFDDRVEDDVFAALTVEAAIDTKKVLGGTATSQVAHQLNRIKERYQWKSR